MKSYVLWAFIGMLGYSFTTLFVKLGDRSPNASPHMILAVSTTIVAIGTIGMVIARGELKTLLFDLDTPPLLWAVLAGLTLTLAVSSLYHALSLGPANIVVPIYGMFIVGSSVLGALLLGEHMPLHRLVGLAAAVIGVVLISL
jgi:transporter family protein